MNRRRGFQEQGVNTCMVKMGINGIETMRFFMGMLDEASVNACILFNFAATTAQTKDRRDFLKPLIRSLTLPHLRDRLALTNIPWKTVTQIREILNKPLDEVVSSGKLVKRKRCGECTSKQNRKTLHCCVRCQLYVMTTEKVSVLDVSQHDDCKSIFGR